MDAILTTFGVDWRLLIINAINFALVLGVLWYFLYTPIMRMLEERRTKVAQGVKDAEAAGIKLSEIEGSRAGVLSKAGAEADQIVSHAQKRAVEKERELLSRAEASAASVIAEAEAEAKESKHRAVVESKEEVAKLIVLGMEKAFSNVSPKGGK
jgi:F-type H+-transporting ATPase subunit b